jgi:hypothetical protein
LAGQAWPRYKAGGLNSLAAHREHHAAFLYFASGYTSFVTLEVIAIAQTADEADFIQLLLATAGMISMLNRSDQQKPDIRRGDVSFINFGEIVIEQHDMTLARQILGEYRQRLDSMRAAD